jgi:RNA polymerase sigma-70 factor (ECF subfamily)
LIQQVLSGDQNAYAEIIRAYQAKVLGLCTTLLGNPHQAEDAAQEVFIKAYQNLRSFKGKSSFSTWLYRITSNHCTDLLRKRSREKSQSLESLIEESGEEIHRLMASAADAAKRLEARDMVERILSFLSPDERLILTLREAQKLSYLEIAETLKCSVDAVKSRLRRARQKLDQNLRHYSEIINV